MDATTPLPPPPASTPGPADPPEEPPLHSGRPLIRPRDGRLVAGVCASLADHFGVDVLLVRVVAVVLAVSGGAGVAAYLALWALTPSSDGPAPVDTGRPVFAAGGPARRRVPQTALIIVLALLVFSAIGHLWNVGALLLVGVALVAVAVLGRRWWVTVLAVAVALLLALGSLVAAGRHLGSHDFRVTRAGDIAGSYCAPTGTVRLDLQGLALDGDRRTTVWVGSGQVLIRVPDGLPVHVDAHAGLGRVSVFGRTAAGPGAEVAADAGPALPGGPRLAIDAVAGTGKVIVEPAD